MAVVYITGYCSTECEHNIGFFLKKFRSFPSTLTCLTDAELGNSGQPQQVPSTDVLKEFDTTVIKVLNLLILYWQWTTRLWCSLGSLATTESESTRLPSLLLAAKTSHCDPWPLIIDLPVSHFKAGFFLRCRHKPRDPSVNTSSLPHFINKPARYDLSYIPRISYNSGLLTTRWQPQNVLLLLAGSNFEYLRNNKFNPTWKRAVFDPHVGFSPKIVERTNTIARDDQWPTINTSILLFHSNTP